MHLENTFLSHTLRTATDQVRSISPPLHFFSFYVFVKLSSRPPSKKSQLDSNSTSEHSLLCLTLSSAILVLLSSTPGLHRPSLFNWSLEKGFIGSLLPVLLLPSHNEYTVLNNVFFLVPFFLSHSLLLQTICYPTHSLVKTRTLRTSAD